MSSFVKFCNFFAPEIDTRYCTRDGPDYRADRLNVLIYIRHLYIQNEKRKMNSTSNVLFFEIIVTALVIVIFHGAESFPDMYTARICICTHVSHNRRIQCNDFVCALHAEHNEAFHWCCNLHIEKRHLLNPNKREIPRFLFFKCCVLGEFVIITIIIQKCDGVPIPGTNRDWERASLAVVSF